MGMKLCEIQGHAGTLTNRKIGTCFTTDEDEIEIDDGKQ